MKSKHFSLAFVAIALATGQANQDSKSARADSGTAERNTFQAAMKAAPAARDAALRTLVQKGHEGAATDALVALIRLHSSDIEPLALPFVARVSELNVRRVLGAAARTMDGHFRAAVARAALDRTAMEGTQTAKRPGEEGGLGTAGVAALLLANTADAGDRDLVGNVVKLRPNDAGLWLFIAKRGIANVDEAKLARSVMQDNQIQPRVRVAAGAALAPYDIAAKTYVIDTLTSFLRDFAPQRAEDIIGRLMTQPPLKPDESQIVPKTPGLGSLGTLEFLQGPDAERLTFEFVDSENLLVRRALGAVAAIRWPDRLLNLNPIHSEERVNLLAALSIVHPELLPRVEAIIPTAELQPMRAKMMADGIEVYQRPGAGIVF